MSIRRALLLALGEYAEKTLPAADRQGVISKLLKQYREDPDAGIHGAAEWLLRQWGQEEQLRKLDRQLASAALREGANWYVTPPGANHGDHSRAGGVPDGLASNRSGPGERVVRGSTPKTDRLRSFAVASKGVTVEQYDEFLNANPRIRGDARNSLRKRF